MAEKNWMQALTKDFGECAEKFSNISESVISLPSPSFNWAVSNGGIPEGRTILFYGPESGGKSLLGQLTEIEIQKKYPDGICALFDTEFAFNKEWFIKLGGDPKRLAVYQTNNPVEIFDFTEKTLANMIKEGCPIKSIRIDSIKGIRFPKDIREKSTDMVMGGTGASYLGAALKGILPVIRRNMITTIFIQQVYEEMDQYKKLRNPYIIPDGRALKHFCDLMIQVERLETKDGAIEAGKTIAGGAAQVGHKVRCKCRKNRVGAPYRVAEFWLEYTKGIVNVGEEVYELGKSLGILHHPEGASNQMWVFGKYAPIRGEDNFRNAILSNVTLQAEIMAACYSVSESAIDGMNSKIQVPEMEGKDE